MDRPATLTEPSRRTPVRGEYDVVVVGGTAGGLSTFCGLHARVHGEHLRVIHGLADELLDRLPKLDGLWLSVHARTVRPLGQGATPGT